VAIDDCKLWSPETPFLYEVEISSGSDGIRIPFGMRSFRFDRFSGRAILNGKPYVMRGTNVCIFRFFEDSLRMDKPWREDWVRRLHQKFKSMHWNSIRYCIGFPPEKWYDIADETGFLIQDEFPIWLLLPDMTPENPKAEFIMPEYRQWMRERWNHPCVVIWDAQNESVTDETGKALQAVRHLDLSNRPWENGWAAPRSPDDVVESHPYLFSKGWDDNKNFYHFEDIAQASVTPRLRDSQKKYDIPVLINEYAWLWLNRDGSPTTITKNLYNHLAGSGSTPVQRFRLYARYLAALTEFWRSYQQAAGVMHFCGLGYARSGELPRPEGGATSDHFIDLEKLTFEPHFEKYVRDAFSPVGIMLDFWQEKPEGGQTRNIDVVLINDQPDNWQGEVHLCIQQNGTEVSGYRQSCTVAPLQRKVLTFTVKFPDENGVYELIGEMEVSGQSIRSRRSFEL
jgi:hypothetical protein